MSAEVGTFPRPVLATLTALALILLVTAGKSRPAPAPDLRARIIAASASRMCHASDGCFNPHILAIETGYFVTTFTDSKPQHAQVRVEALSDYLVRLPISAWSRGP
jgi:hypothetical protein